MYKIVTRRQLNDSVVLMEIDAPYIAAKAEAGQFIIYRVDEKGERVPLTIADYDREKGTITIIFQVVGASTTDSMRATISMTLLVLSALLQSMTRVSRELQ